MESGALGLSDVPPTADASVMARKLRQDYAIVIGSIQGGMRACGPNFIY